VKSYELRSTRNVVTNKTRYYIASKRVTRAAYELAHIFVRLSCLCTVRRGNRVTHYAYAQQLGRKI